MGWKAFLFTPGPLARPRAWAHPCHCCLPYRDLGWNQLTGTIPAAWAAPGAWPNLRKLWVGRLPAGQLACMPAQDPCRRAAKQGRPLHACLAELASLVAAFCTPGLMVHLAAATAHTLSALTVQCR